MAAAAIRSRAASAMSESVLATASLESPNVRFPQVGLRSEPASLVIGPGESMAIFDRFDLRRRMRLEPSHSVVMDEFGGDFQVDCFESRRELLVIPIGHANQELWPETIVLDQTFEVGTDTASLAFLGTGRVSGGLLDLATVWPCRPGTYWFYYEEIVEFGASTLKQALARNIIIAREGRSRGS